MVIRRIIVSLIDSKRFSTQACTDVYSVNVGLQNGVGLPSSQHSNLQHAATALHTDMASTGNMLGRALEVPERAARMLRRFNIILTDPSVFTH